MDARLLHLEIDVDVTPIRGTAWRGDRAAAQEFSGWMGLAQAIESARDGTFGVGPQCEDGGGAAG